MDEKSGQHEPNSPEACVERYRGVQSGRDIRQKSLSGPEAVADPAEKRTKRPSLRHGVITCEDSIEAFFDIPA
jgi:hypothetical protein